MILHIALPQDWADAQETGFYRVSTRGVSIAQQGFMHASKNMDQATRVHGFVYSDVENLLLLHIDENRLTDAGLQVRMEPGDPTDPKSEKFPHIYGGDMPVSVVVDVTPWSAT